MIPDYEEIYKQRRERLSRAYALKEPDRVPLSGSFGFFATKYGGITVEDSLTDYEKQRKAVVKTSVDFGFDTAAGGGGIYALPLVLAMMRDYDGIVTGMINIPLHKALGMRYGRFPGMEIQKDTPPQFIGQEFMKVDEYDDLIENPHNFISKKIIPRSFEKLETPNSPKAMAALIRYGEESLRYREAMMKIGAELRGYGFPSFSGGFSYAPLDFISDYLRDIKNVLYDTFRVPDKVKQATEAVKELILELAKITAKTAPKGAHAFIPLHLNEYFSPKQYHEFYWPTLKEVVDDLIKLGFTPSIFYEGYHDAHLESILELPKGKTIAKFEKTDLGKAKEIIGDHACIVGGPPASLFLSGTPSKIDEYVKNLMEQVKEGGGFVLSPAVNIPSGASPENVKALMDAVKRHGVY